MKKLASFCFPVLLLALSVTEAQPPREYSLVIDGVEHDIRQDAAQVLRVGGEDHRFELRVKPFRTFEHRGISFRFPENMMFAYDGEAPPSWEFNGSNTVIMLQEYEGVSEPVLQEILVAGIKAQFEGLEVTEKPVRETFGGRTLTGTQLVMVMPDFESHQDIYFFTLNERVYALFLQDVVDSDGVHTGEFEALMDLMRETLVLKD